MTEHVHEVIRGRRQFLATGTVEPAKPPLRCLLVIELVTWEAPTDLENGSPGSLDRREFKLEVTSDLQIRTVLTPMDRELLAPLVQKLIESLLEEHKREAIVDAK